jgi:hypothetical protein
MGISRYFTGLAIDGTRHNVKEIPTDCVGAPEGPDARTQSAPTYRLTRDGNYLEKTGDFEFKIIRSGQLIRVL